MRRMGRQVVPLRRGCRRGAPQVARRLGSRRRHRPRPGRTDAAEFFRQQDTRRNRLGCGTYRSVVTGHQWWWEVRYEDARPRPYLDDRERNSHSGGRAVRLILELDRRDPFVLGAEPCGKTGPDSRAARTCSISRRTGPASIAANAPSSAARSMPIWRIVVIAEPRAAFDAWRDRPTRGRPIAAGIGRGQARAATRVSERALRDVPHDSRDRGRRHGRRRTLPMWPAGRRRGRHATMSRGNPGGLDRRSARRSSQAPTCRWCDLDGDELNAIVAYLEGLR